MLDPEKDLGGQTKSQSHSGNLCSGEAFRERIFSEGFGYSRKALKA